MTAQPVKTFVILKAVDIEMHPLASIGRWHREQREQANRQSSIDHILSPFWRSMAINAYDLFERESLEAQVRAFVRSAFGARRARELHTLLNLRLKLGHHAQRTGEILETFLFTETQFDDANDKPCVVVTMTINASTDARLALQLRSPSFPIGAQARHAMAYTSDNGTRQKVAAAAAPAQNIFADAPFKAYNARQRAECMLIARYVNRGVFLYEELRAAQQFETLALLLAECRVKAAKQADAEQQKRERARNSKRKKKADASAVVAVDDEAEGSITLTDSEDDDDAAAAIVSDKQDVEYVNEAVVAGDVASANAVEQDEKSLSGGDASSGDETSSMQSVHLSSDDENNNVADVADEDDDDKESKAIYGNRSALRRREIRGQRRVDIDDDEDADADDKEDGVPLLEVARSAKRKQQPCAPPSTAVDISKRAPKVADVEPLLLDVARPDELQWARMIVARRAYTLTLKISCITPDAERLIGVCRERTIPIEAGVSFIPRYFAVPDSAHMKFYICNVADLTRMTRGSSNSVAAATATAGATTDATTDTLTTIVDAVDYNVAAACAVDDLVSTPTSKLLVETQPMPAQDYRDERHTTVLPDRFPDEWLPLDDIKTLDTDVCALTLYEITCYTRQRLGILLAAYRGYYLAKSYEEKQVYVDALNKSQYPVRSGASYYIIRTLKGAQAREMMHEGIGLAMLCMIAKSNATLQANLMLMEMCLVKHRLEQQTLEYTDRDADIDSDRSGSGGGGAVGPDEQYVEARVKRHAEHIARFLDTCENVLCDEWAAEVAHDAERDTYENFFQMLRELSGEWQEALQDIVDKTVVVDDDDDDENKAHESQEAV